MEGQRIMKVDRIQDIIRFSAIANKLPERIILALVEKESTFQPNVIRFEPKYRWLVTPEKFVTPSNTLETEKMLQKCSFGLFQIMGGNIRTLGLEGSLPKAFDIPTNVSLGMRFLIKLFSKYSDVRDALSAYNAGSPSEHNQQTYVDVILDYSKKY
jgi:soluble lytic murein transglycosylase-like protein